MIGMTYTVLDGYPRQTEGIYFDQELDERLQEARKYHPLANTTLDLLSCIEFAGPMLQLMQIPKTLSTVTN
jgi:hypothetical protein